MKNLTPKSIAIGAGLTGTTAALAYAAPLVAQLYSGVGWVAIALTAVPTLIAFLTDAKKKVEGGESK